MNKLGNFIVASLMLTSPAAAQEQTYVTEAPSATALDAETYQIPAEISVPEGTVLNSVNTYIEADIDFDHYAQTSEFRYALTGEQTTRLVFVPPEYQASGGLTEIYNCGQILAINDGTYTHSFSQTYIFEQKAESDPAHHITVSTYQETVLNIGAEFLQTNSFEDCNSQLNSQAFLAAQQGGIAPIIIP